MKLLKPSFENGFARCQSESEFPKLWDGLIGAWAPLLGYQGNSRLLDLSGNGYDGVLTSFSGSVWGADRFGPNLLWDGAGNVVCGISGIGPGLKLSGTSFCTIAAWVYRTAGTRSGFTFNQASNRVEILWFSDNTIYCVVENGGISTPSALRTDTGWHHIALVYDGTLSASSRPSLYLDGIKITLSVSGTPAATIHSSIGSGAPSQFIIGRSDGGLADSAGNKTAIALLYNRALSAGEVLQLVSAPDAPFVKRRRIQAGESGQALTLSVSDSMTMGEESVKAPGVVKADLITLADARAQNVEVNKSETALTFSDADTVSGSKSIADTIGLSDFKTLALAKAHVEIIAFTDAALVSPATFLSVSDSFNVTDTYSSAIAGHPMVKPGGVAVSTPRTNRSVRYSETTRVSTFKSPNRTFANY